MARFEVLASSIIVGHSELEGGDPPMGVATGKFMPLPAYAAIKASVVASRDSSQEHLSLAVRSSDGQLLPAQGGVQIVDYSAELGAEGIEVHVLGIDYPLYAELFPEHVTAYKNQFRDKD
jgi:hypothetical protein